MMLVSTAWWSLALLVASGLVVGVRRRFLLTQCRSLLLLARRPLAASRLSKSTVEEKEDMRLGAAASSYPQEPKAAASL